MKLRPYQKRMVQEIINNPAVMLISFMSSGKSLSTLQAIDFLHSIGEVSKVLIIAPRMVAESTWTDEIEKWGFDLLPAVVMGNPTKRMMAVCSRTTIHIINFENLQWLDDTFDKWPYDMVVVDESSKIKSHSTKRFKLLKRRRGDIKRWINLTGTPTPNSIHDIWSQIYLLDQGKSLGRNVTAFRNRWFQKDYMGYNWVPRPGAEEQIREACKHLCVTLLKEDYHDLPPVIFNDIHVTLGEKVHAKYKKLEKEMFLKIGEAEIEAINAAVLSNKCLQFSNGALYSEDGEGVDRVYEVLHDGKIEALGEIIEQTDSSILVATNFKSDVSRIQAAYPTAQVLRGKKEVTAWNAGQIPLLLAHPASCGHGLNLQGGGHTLVWFGLNWSLELYEQMNARLDRTGQEHPVVIHHLITKGTVDEAVMDRLKSKSDSQQALMRYMKRDVNC